MPRALACDPKWYNSVLGLYRDNAQENGTYYSMLGLYKGMEKKVETTVVDWGYSGNESGNYWKVDWGYIRIMDKQNGKHYASSANSPANKHQLGYVAVATGPSPGKMGSNSS